MDQYSEFSFMSEKRETRSSKIGEKSGQFEKRLQLDSWNEGKVPKLKSPTKYYIQAEAKIDFSHKTIARSGDVLGKIDKFIVRSGSS